MCHQPGTKTLFGNAFALHCYLRLFHLRQRPPVVPASGFSDEFASPSSQTVEATAWSKVSGFLVKACSPVAAMMRTSSSGIQLLKYLTTLLKHPESQHIDHGNVRGWTCAHMAVNPQVDHAKKKELACFEKLHSYFARDGLLTE